MTSGTDELTSLTFRAVQDLVNGVANPNDTVGGIDTTYSKPPSTFFSGELLRKPRSSFAKRWWGLALVVCVLRLSYRHSPTVHFVLSRCSSKTFMAWNKRFPCRRQCFGIGFPRCEGNMAPVLRVQLLAWASFLSRTHPCVIGCVAAGGLVITARRMKKSRAGGVACDPSLSAPATCMCDSWCGPLGGEDLPP